ncbi:MAG: ABC transporter substrate-binding protein [Chthoniobacterales bacterium]|nr:ABC transporter substrate-binding protein [Chthoniobacterales bacterium]
MKARQIICFLWIMWAFLLVFAKTYAENESLVDAENTLRFAVNQVLTVAKNSRNRVELERSVRPILERYIDFAKMTQLAIGAGWRALSTLQREQAAVDFTTLVIRSYSDKLKPGEFPEIEVRSARDLGQGRVEVPTTLRYQGSEYEVAYRMHKMNQWRVTDVIIEGVSFVANYRSQFDEIYKRGGAEAVAKTLHTTANRMP